MLNDRRLTGPIRSATGRAGHPRARCDRAVFQSAKTTLIHCELSAVTVNHQRPIRIPLSEIIDYMDKVTLIDFITLIRSAEFSPGLLGLVISSRRSAADFVEEFERIVRPVIDETVTEQEVRDRVSASLLATSTKLSFLIRGYAQMANVAFRIDLAVLGSALARLYDDLFDEVGGPHLDHQLAQLFDGADAVATNDVEQLIIRLYQEAYRLLERTADDPVFFSLIRLHEYQIKSRQQRSQSIPAGTLLDITLGKGGHGLAVLFGMMRPAMNLTEHGLIVELGGALQLLDDYQDFELDRLNGITTNATRYCLSLSEIAMRLKSLRRDMIAFYGRRKAHKFFCVVYATMWISYFRRRIPHIGTRNSQSSGSRTATALGVLLTPGDNLLQNAADRTRVWPGR